MGRCLNAAHIAIIILVFAITRSNPTIAQQRSPELRSVNFTYKTTITDIPKTSSKIYIWLPIPPSDDYQKIKNLTVRSAFPYKEVKDTKYGNRILFIDASNCKNPEVGLSVTFDVERKERCSFNAVHPGLTNDKDPAANPNLIERFLEPSRLAIIDDDIRTLATVITKDQKGDIQKARAIYDYLIQKMEYNKEAPGWGRGDTKRALIVCKGNCSDFHAAFTSLACAAGIPSRFEYGFTIPPQASEGNATRHCWVEFYAMPYGWIPIDVSEADKHPELTEYYFGNHDRNRILFSTGRDISLTPAPHKGEPLNFLIDPYVEVDGKTHTNIKLLAMYKDLPIE